MREWAWRKTIPVQLLVLYRSWTSYVVCLLRVDKADGLDAWRELLIRLGLKSSKAKTAYCSSHLPSKQAILRSIDLILINAAFPVPVLIAEWCCSTGTL